MRSHRIVIGGLGIVGACAHADLPLTVEELITDQGKTKIDLSVAYSNAERQGVSTGEPFVIQTGPTSFITLPTRIGESIHNSDIAVLTLGLRRGVAAKAEVYGRFSAHTATLLKAMDKGNSRASFDDMAGALTEFGFRAQGFAASWEQLARLKVPVVLYVKHRQNDHFTVLRGISGDVVWLADPSQGNRTYSRDQFLAMWETRSGANDGLAGKFLAVLPIGASAQELGDFFTRKLARQSAPAVSTLADRSWLP